MIRVFRILFLCVAVTFLTGCHSLRTKGLLGKIWQQGPLKVGIAADSPPLAYKKGEDIIGLETGFAQGLAESVGRKLTLVELPRDGLAKALLTGKVDIVMAGMTVPDAHKQKLATTNPYLLSGQVALVHLDDVKQLGSSANSLTSKNVRIGVVSGSSGEDLLRGLKPKGTTDRFASAPEAVLALIADRIDVFVFDLPANFYYADRYVDKGLTPGSVLMTHEELAWAIRPDDSAMRTAANTYLAVIEQDGTLQTMIEHSLPFYRHTAYSPGQ